MSGAEVKRRWAPLGRGTDSQATVIAIDDDGDELVSTISLPAEASLRSTLLDAGWRPTGRKGKGRVGAIFVTRGEDGPRPS